MRTYFNVNAASSRLLCYAFVAQLLSQSATAGADGWFTHAGNAQHTAVSLVASQPLEVIHWAKPVDLAKPSGTILIHYGSPLATPGNTIVVPIKTTSGGSFKINAFRAKDGSLLWSKTTDYVLPAHNWMPSYSPCLTPTNRVYFAGAGGTVYYRDDADSSGAAASGQLAFYGIANYQADPASFNTTVFINTPITSDGAGNIYFGFRVAGTAPLSLTSGIARIDANGNGAWTSAVSASGGDANVAVVPHQAAPALSNDGQTLYAVVRSSSSTGTAYLVGLNPATLAFKFRVRLKDPRNSGANNPWIADDSSATPMVGPDGDVYYGVLGNPNNGSRGWMLHFSGDLSQIKTPGAFGWDNTASIVPATMVPSYSGNSSYLIFTKFNNYAGYDGGDGTNRVAVLDPNDTMVEPHASSNGQLVMKTVLTVVGPTPDPEYLSTYPNAVREWCINTAAVDPFTKSVLVNSEDGKLYRWDLTTNTLAETITLSPGIGEAYTPTIIGPDGTVYAINSGILDAVGKRPSLSINNVSIAEGNSGTKTATFTVSASSASTEAITVDYATSDGTATAGSDYTATRGTLVISTGQTSNTISVPILGDADFEPDETFFVNLSSSTGATIADGQGKGTIRNDDIETSLDVPDAAGYAGGSVTLTAKLTATADGSPVPSQSVHFHVAGTDAGTGTTDADGIAHVVYGIPSSTPVGSLQIACDFAGGGGFAISTGAGTLYIRKKPSLVASGASGAIDSSVTLKATLKDGTFSLTGRTIRFLIDGVDVGSSTTGSTGQALVAHKLTESVGTHQIKAAFDGDGTYAPFTSAAATLTVKFITTTLTVATITASPGQTTNLKAVLKAGTVFLSGESVTFAIDGTTVGSANTDSGGVALLSHVVTESLGSHAVTATFAGDGVKYGPSTGTGTMKVLAPTKITADVLKAPAGSSVSFGAKLVRSDTLTPLDGKTLSFYSGTTLMGTGVTNASGRATINVTAPAPGVKMSITVKFIADSQYKGSSATGSVTGT